jgi:hypothetical protein
MGKQRWRTMQHNETCRDCGAAAPDETGNGYVEPFPDAGRA